MSDIRSSGCTDPATAMLANNRERWGSLAKTLHWTIVVLILLEIPAGFLMSYTYGLAFQDERVRPLHDFASQLHHTNGLLILLLVIVRLSWRLTRLGPVSKWSANAVHFALYALLLILPLSGWAALSVFGKAPIWFFNTQHIVPPILPVLPLSSKFGYGLFAHIHVWALWTGAVLLSVHVVAALWHQWVLKDDILLRMWPLARAHRIDA